MNTAEDVMEAIRILVWLTCTLFVSSLLLFPSAADADSRMSLEVTLRESPLNRFVLHIKLTNTGSDALSIHQEQLPWNSPYTIVSVMRWNGHEGVPLREVFLSAHRTVLKLVSIAPGESLEGDASIGLRALEFPSVLDQTDVIVFWNYEPRSNDKPTGQRLQGALLIPRRRP